jgi:hypothetical protein
MRNLILTILLFVCSKTTFSQSKGIYNGKNFFTFNVGTEYKRNNSDSLTSGIINYTPLIRLSAGLNFYKNLYYSMTFSNNRIDLKIGENRINYKKNAVGIFLGLSNKTTKLYVRNQVGIQFNNYSLTNLKQDNLNKLDSFSFVGNHFESKSDTYLVYGFELSSSRNKNLNLMSGFNTCYAIGKPTILTKKPNERLVFQIYFGLCYTVSH